eukprot:PhF_6_TR34173/c0_g1_i1/m.50003/K01285/PRCP; lysosomal Pro-X carboxypeptidase
MSSLSHVLICIVLIVLIAAPIAQARRHNSKYMKSSHPFASSNNCTEMYFTQYVDHFTWRSPVPLTPLDTYQQRYFVCGSFFNSSNAKKHRVMFFYTGNEAPVDLYVNHTGLMWENAQEFGALLVFAEHRYYGKSQPCAGGFTSCGAFLSVEQALADYAALITSLKAQYSVTRVVSFGGSYGGMLTAWFRMKYPHIVDGGIAASAPILGFVPEFDGARYWSVVSYDATPAAGSSPNCFNNVVNSIQAVRGGVAANELQTVLGLCNPVVTASDVDAVARWVMDAFDALAMGNYPYPSDYISGDAQHPMPAWPMRAACSYLSGANMTGLGVLANLRSAIGVVLNTTQDVQCYSLQGSSSVVSDIWDYQVCTEGMPQEDPYYATQGPPNDMFWQQPTWNSTRLTQYCNATHGVTPRIGWMPTEYGMDRIRAASN